MDFDNQNQPLPTHVDVLDTQMSINNNTFADQQGVNIDLEQKPIEQNNSSPLKCCFCFEPKIGVIVLLVFEFINLLYIVHRTIAEVTLRSVEGR